MRRDSKLCVSPFPSLPLLSSCEPPNENINPQGQEKSSFNYSSHKNFVSLEVLYNHGRKHYH